ncbi:MAG: sugar ABC transporter permease [Eubacteriales bacterium]|nr:sugar ABC transporter permease [Eubacteriales bacterium]
MKRRYRQMNWFYLPALLVMLLFVAYPFLQTAQISLMRWNGYGKVRTFIGLDNYISMFKDANFFLSFRNTLIYGICCTLLQNVFGLALALLVNSRFKGNGLVRTIVYMPIMIAGVVMGYIMYFFLTFNRGILNDILLVFGVQPRDWLSSPFYAVLFITLINSWQYVGNSMVMYLAGLQNIPTAYYEAAAVDGVSTWQGFRHITLPLLIPSIQTCVITNLIGSLKLFDVIVSLTNGGPGHSSQSLATYITNRYFVAEKAGYAAAIGVFTFFFIMILSNVLNRYFAKKEVQY